MKHAISFIVGVVWLAGIAIAKGFWSTLFSLLMPLWAWYLVVERIVNKLL